MLAVSCLFKYEYKIPNLYEIVALAQVFSLPSVKKCGDKKMFVNKKSGKTLLHLV